MEVIKMSWKPQERIKNKIDKHLTGIKTLYGLLNDGNREKFGEYLRDFNQSFD